MSLPNEQPVPSAAAPPEGEGGTGLPKSFEQLDRKRRGVKPGQKRGSYSKSPPARPAAAEVVRPPVEAFTPDAMRPLVSLPFNLAFVKTGFEGFLLSPVEEANLSHSGAAVFNQWVQIDPRWLAIITFSLALTSLSVQKTMLYRNALARFNAEQEEKRKAAEAVKV